MSELYRAYTPEQEVEAMRDYIVAKNVGLSDWNEGSNIRVITEAVANRTSAIQFDFVNALRKAIRTMFFAAFRFEKKVAVGSTGFFRLYRRPLLTINYTGTGTSALLSVTATNLIVTVTGAGDSINLAFATYPTIAALSAAVDALGTYSSDLVQDGDSTSLYIFSNREIIGAFNYRGNAGTDMVTTVSPLVAVSAGVRFIVDDQVFVTTGTANIAAGESSTPQIAAAAETAGPLGNIIAEALDTENGKGTAVNLPSGAEYAMNDTSFSGGRNEETDAEQNERFQVTIAGLTGGTERGIEAAALSIAEIRSVNVLSSYPQNGTVTIVADDGTGNLPAPVLAKLQKVIIGDPTDRVNFPGKVAAGITAAFQAPTVTPVSWNIVVYRIGTLSDPDAVKDAAQAAVEQYVNTLKMAEDVVLQEAGRRIKNSHAAIYDVTFTSPSANVPISGFATARSGTAYGAPITITLVTFTTPP